MEANEVYDDIKTDHPTLNNDNENDNIENDENVMTDDEPGKDTNMTE